MSGGARHRNKTANSESNSQAPANEVEKKPKSHRGGGSSSSPQKSSSGLIWKLLSLVFYAGLVGVCGCSGWVVYNLQDELSQISNSLQHISQQKADLADTVHALQKQVKGLETTVGRLEFISKDIQEKQVSQESSIKKSEKDLDQIGVILKKFQREFSSDIQVVKEQRETDSIHFENAVKEKFTELNNSLNEGIKDVIEVQKASQDEINLLKDKLASLGEFQSIQGELENIKRTTHDLQTSVQSNGDSVQWLMNNAQNVDTVTANSNEIQNLRENHNDLKRNLDVAIEELKGKISNPSELERFTREYEQMSSSFSEIQIKFDITKNDLLKEFESSTESLEMKLKPIEKIIENLSSQSTQQSEEFETLKTNFEEVKQKLTIAEEALVDGKQKTSGDAETEHLTNLKEGLTTLSTEVDTLKSTVADLPNIFEEFEKLQTQITGALEAHKVEYDQFKSNIEENTNKDGSVQQFNVEDITTNIAKLETDLKMLRTAVDSLVAYSVKIETNQKELENMKDSLEVLQQSTDTLMEKLEQIQENV
ncbi:hypothetical protein GDO86_005090 [Hymenochirus boettgeri]|uniref:Cytoskeleton-associated protein 4 n=1 Tax=Hymenochirus boettgeri TaxID=247094 RepID=A0A8T2J813_9PIPI|nr:hypothetical protein GDO86_005090 [Hymenochirus boettgeri]